MLPGGELIPYRHGRRIADLFDDGQPQTVVAWLVRIFVESAEDAAAVEGFAGAGIADAQMVGAQLGEDLAVFYVVTDGVAEQVVEQNIDELPVGGYGGLGEVEPALEVAGVEQLLQLLDLVEYDQVDPDIVDRTELTVVDLREQQQGLL